MAFRKTNLSHRPGKSGSRKKRGQGSLGEGLGAVINSLKHLLLCTHGTRLGGAPCLGQGHPPAPGAVLHIETQEVIEHRLPERQREPGVGQLIERLSQGQATSWCSRDQRQDPRGSSPWMRDPGSPWRRGQPAQGQDTRLVLGTSRLTTPPPPVPKPPPTLPLPGHSGSGRPLAFSSCHLFIAAPR